MGLVNALRTTNGWAALRVAPQVCTTRRPILAIACLKTKNA